MCRNSHLGVLGAKIKRIKIVSFFGKIVLLGVRAIHRRMGVRRLLGFQKVPLVRVLRNTIYIYIYITPSYIGLFSAFRLFETYLPGGPARAGSQVWQSLLG